MKVRTFVLGLLPLALACNSYGDMELVSKGKPVAEIVVATNALSGVKLAAKDLQEHLEKMSGAKLAIVSAPSETARNHVYVGTNEFTRQLGFKLGEFKNSGFEIVARDNYAILAGVDIQRAPTPYEGPDGLKKWQEFCGEKFNFAYAPVASIGRYNRPLGIYSNDDLGTWYAVAELLEQLGVRWYMPYENGTVIPHKQTIAVADQHLKKEAAFARREFCLYSAARADGESIAWFKRLKLGNNNIIIWNHTAYDIYSSPEQQKLHPEYLACDASGKPYPGSPAGAGIPRYSHPGFRKAAVTYMNKMFEAIPDLAAMAIGPQDGGVIMLDARDDANLYGKPADSLVQKTSNYMCDFMMFLAKELKKSHPDKYLIYTLLCAANADVVPNNVEEFPDNVILSFVSFQSAYMASENSLMQAKLDNRKQWLAKMRTGNKGPFWDYFLYYSYNRKGHGMNGEPCSPVFFTDYLQRSMQEMRPYSDGKFMEIVEEKCQVDGDKNPRYRLRWPGLMHLMVYWQSKLFWDPDMDRKKMLDEYYDLFFGPARAEMKEFYEFAEDVWTRQEWSVIPNNALKQKDVERYFDILKRAHDKAGKDTVYDKRISQIEGEMPKRSGPRIEAYRAPEPVKIDGDLDKYPAAWRVPLRNLSTGELPATNKTEAIIALAPDGSSLIVGVTCYENKMDKLRASCTLNDNAGIFNDDAVEVYVNTPERSYISSYFKIVVNPNGAIWDESTDVAIVGRDTLLTENDSLRILWNPGTRAVVKKYDDRWTAEILIPTKDFGKSGPTESSPWGIQVGRTRFTGGSGVMVSAIAPTAAGYATLNRWGFLYMK